ncbi:MAG: alkaline phosphatase [Rectinemataceae bacterium]|nr:alkaline phosphatase [Rectinemataceae bacterium]
MAIAARGVDPGRIGWTTAVHTGLSVATFASGTGQELFTGNYDNTAIFRKLSAVMGLNISTDAPVGVLFH